MAADGNGNVASAPWEKLPYEARERLRAHLSLTDIRAAACCDLDAYGRFANQWLALGPDTLWHVREQDGAWIATALDLAAYEAATLDEGIGMGVLRLAGASGGGVEVFRFSRRHARAMAGLQRLLEARFRGRVVEADAPAQLHEDAKKLRCEKCGGVIPAWSEVCPACLSRRKVLSRLLGFVRPYRWRAIAGFSLAMAGTVMGLVRPFLTRPMLDNGLGAAPGQTPDYGLLLYYIAWLAGITIVAAGTEAMRERLMATLGSRISRDIRNRAYRHLHKLSLSFFSRKPTGSLVSRITSDSDRIWDFVTFTLVELAIAVLTILGVGAALFVLDWRLAFIVLLPVPVMFFLTFFFHRKLHKGFGRMFHHWSQLTAVVSDALPGVRVIKAFSQERREVDRFEVRNQAFYDDEVGMIMIWTLFRPVMQLCTQTGTLLVWIVGGYWVVQGRMSPGTLVAYISYMWMFYGPVHMVAHMDRMFNRAATSVQRILEILDTEPAIFSRTGALPADTIRGQLQFENVGFSYDGIRQILKDVNLTIEPGTMIGLAGPSGGGKTTLINLICRFYDVAEGAIRIDGKDLRDYDIEAVRRQIGVVLQEPFLFHGTVAGNIAYGNTEATLDAIVAAARAANAHDFIVGFPDGYDTMVGERGHTLSGGERQRISIARAILNNPRILILDEATSSVDTETEHLIQEALDRLTARRTTIAIAHRLSTLRKADRLVILDKGRIVEEGTHAELSGRAGGVYAKLLAMQAELQSALAIPG